MTWVDLTRPFDADAEHSLSLSDPRLETLSDVGEDGANVQQVTFPTHSGTHVDAPLHVVPGGSTIDETPLSRLVTQGVVLGVDAESARPVGVEDLRGLDGLRDGDAVVFSFGWAEYGGTDRYHRYPWLSTALADWLVEREVALVATDTLSPDQPRGLRGDDDPYPVHRRLLGAGVPVVENLADPSDLVGECVEVICLPLKLRGATVPRPASSRGDSGIDGTAGRESGMGYSTASTADVDSLIDEQYGGMWMLREALGCENLGISLIELEPGGKGKPHDHTGDGQEEVYLVLDGVLDVDLGAETVTLGSGEAVRVSTDQHRQLVNRDEERVRLVVAGAD